MTLPVKTTQRQEEFAFETHWVMEKIGLQLAEAMREQKVTRAQLVERLHRLRPRREARLDHISVRQVDNLIDGKTADIDLRLLVDLFYALGYALNVLLEPKVRPALQEK